jgi:hypothetical protein
MSDRGNQLFATAGQQITELEALLSTTDESVLRSRCPGREKLGDGTVGAIAQHTADTYMRIAEFVRGQSQTTHSPPASHHSAIASLPELIERLSAGRSALMQLAQLSDTELDVVPPAGQARFCDGQRTLEEVLAGMLKHQSRQIDALRAAIS